MQIWTWPLLQSLRNWSISSRYKTAAPPPAPDRPQKNVQIMQKKSTYLTYIFVNKLKSWTLDIWWSQMFVLDDDQSYYINNFSYFLVFCLWRYSFQFRILYFFWWSQMCNDEKGMQFLPLSSEFDLSPHLRCKMS